MRGKRRNGMFSMIWVEFLNTGAGSDASDDAPPRKKTKRTSKKSDAEPEVENFPQHVLEGMALDDFLRNPDSAPLMGRGAEEIEKSERETEEIVARAKNKPIVLLSKDWHGINLRGAFN